MKDYSQKIKESAGFLNERLGPAPRTAIVFGSGLGQAEAGGRTISEIEYSGIPYFPRKELEGHERVVRIQSYPEKLCLVYGRYHLYEGLSVQETVFPVRVLAEWGVGEFFLTNAAASLREDFGIGDLMLIRDHIGLLMPNPLPWPGEEGNAGNFIDMSKAYDETLRSIAVEEAAHLGIELKEGVYVGLPGPSFETPSEINTLRFLHADAVGMSTIPEVIALRHMRKRVMAVSCLTNYGAGMKPGELSHSEVVRTASESGRTMLELLVRVALRSTMQQHGISAF